MFLSATHRILRLEPSKVIPETIPSTNTTDRLPLRPDALHLTIARNIAFKWKTVVVRVARVAMEIVELKILVVSNIGADSHVSFVPAKKAKGAIGVEGELGWRCGSIGGYAHYPQVVGVVDVWARQGVDATSSSTNVEVRVRRCRSLGLSDGFGDVCCDNLKCDQQQGFGQSQIVARTFCVDVLIPGTVM